MNEYKRIVLQRNEECIVRDVCDPSFSDIVDHLLSKNVITAQEKETISNNSSKTATLLNLLYQKDAGSPWFEEFISSLKKDYNWISESLSKEYEEETEQKLAYYLVGRGHVPPLPQHNVPRTAYVEDLRQSIANLKRDSFLVVHGMPGWGKTCLVIDALHNIKLLEESLEGCVYWISVGDMGDEPDELQCRQLQKKLCDMINLPINNQQEYSAHLKLHFSLRPNYSALLVLDKVKSSKVVDALNVGCKILVTTQNTEVVKKYSRKQLFPIKKGFSESESVGLLQHYVCGNRNLPPNFKEKAIEIHHSWKGHPMAIGLIGGDLSEFREESQRNITRWQEHVRPLRRGSDENRRNSLVAEHLSSVIELTTSKLQEDLKNRFEKLVVLVEDTNITIDVLKILWGLNERDVRSTLDQLYRRSLVFYKLNIKDIPVYGVHDMVMEYLTKITSKEDLKAMNLDLVHKYKKACNGNFANLPQDNYIFSYLCHHIERADLWDDCRDQLLSLRYIESKLRATGPADLLLDLNKYQIGLSGTSLENYSKIEEIKRLVEDNGWEIHFKNEIDIVQCALLQPNDSFLYHDGVKLAKESKTPTVYFSRKHSSEKNRDLEMPVDKNVSTVGLISRPLSNSYNRCSEHRVLMYPYACEGQSHIAEIDMRFRRPRQSFDALNNMVVMLKVSPCGDRFLSAHSNGTVNVWSLTSADTPPPSMKQKNFAPFYYDTRTTPSMSYSHERRVTCACFSSNGKMIMSTSEDKFVHVWNLENDFTVNKFKINLDPYAISCSFISGDQVLAYACQNFKIFFHYLQSTTPFSIGQIDKIYGNLLCLLSVTDESGKLLIVQEKAVHLCCFKNQVFVHRRFGDRDVQYAEKPIRLLQEFENKITCAAYCGKHRLLLGSNQGSLLLLDTNQGGLQDVGPASTFCSGRVMAVDVIADRVLFVRDGSMKLSSLQLSNKNSTGKPPSIVHIGWNSRDDSVFTTAARSGDIKVFHDGKLVYDEKNLSKRPSIVQCYRDSVLMGTFDGEVVLIDTISKNKHPLSDSTGMEVDYLSVETDGSNLFYVVGSKQNGKRTESYSLQVFNQYFTLMSCESISASVIKTFFSSVHSSLIIVLRNYSILIYRFKNAPQYLSLIHEGREAATVTDACLSHKENMIFLTDLEKCYHIYQFKWPKQNLRNNINDALNMDSLYPVISESYQSEAPIIEASDEVDGIRVSSLPNHEIEVLLNSPLLKGPSLCCCMCSEENFVAIGYDTNRILIYDTRKKRVIHEFQVLPSLKTAIHKLKFSPYDVEIKKYQFKLILFVVTDCLSVWDMSPLILDNAGYAENVIKCIGCVNASGDPLLELAINDSCNKFCAFDKNCTYFLWNVWKEDED